MVDCSPRKLAALCMLVIYLVVILCDCEPLIFRFPNLDNYNTLSSRWQDMRLSEPGLSRANAVTACLTTLNMSCLEVPSQLFTEVPLHMRGNMRIIQPAAMLEFKVRSISSY